MCPHTRLVPLLTVLSRLASSQGPSRESESVCTILSPCSHVSYSCPLLREVLLTTPLNVAYPFPVILGPACWFPPAMQLSKSNTYIILYAYDYIDLFVRLSPHLDEVTGDQESYLFHSLSSPHT